MRVPFLALTCLAACAAPAARETPVGRTTRAYADSARTDWSGVSPRPLAATIWYPAKTGSVETELRIGVFRFGRSAQNADFVDMTRRPLVVLSHGTGGSALQLAWLAEALASQGFVVAGVNHHGNTAAEDTVAPAGFVLPWERALDLSVLIDRLLADPEVRAHIDTTRIAVAGFSLGGYTALALAGARLDYAQWRQTCTAEPTAPFCALPPEASFSLADVDSMERTDAAFAAGVARHAQETRDPRVRAVFAIAPALTPRLDTASLRAISVPVRVLLASRDDQVPAGTTATELSRYLSTATVNLHPDAGHYTFLAECSLRGRVVLRALCVDAGATRAEVHAQAARDVIEFMQREVRSTPYHAEQRITR